MAKRRNRVFIWLLLTAGAFYAPSARAQAKLQLEYQVKAAFLYNFTRFINWPATAFKSPDAPFVIGIVGADPFGAYLDKIVLGEKIDEHPIVIQRYDDIYEVANCQVLFVATIDPVQIKDIVAIASRHSILTVSDADNFTNAGGVIRFFIDENKVKLEINLAAARASQLEISSKLLRISKIVRVGK